MVMFQMSFKEAASGRGGDDERKWERRHTWQLSMKILRTCHTAAAGFSLWWFLPPSAPPSEVLSYVNHRDDITLSDKRSQQRVFFWVQSITMTRWQPLEIISCHPLCLAKQTHEKKFKLNTITQRTSRHAALKTITMGWSKGSLVKSAYCSSISQYLHRVAHNCL